MASRASDPFRDIPMEVLEADLSAPNCLRGQKHKKSAVSDYQPKYAN